MHLHISKAGGTLFPVEGKKPAPDRPQEAHDHPLLSLPREDLDLVLELVLASGSLKDVAASYGVSYPTLRLRLDRTIQRLRDVLSGRARDPFAELLADLIDRGELTPAAARVIKDAARKSKGASP
jgi:hypothetical protein